jgi:hypothetical protein
MNFFAKSKEFLKSKLFYKMPEPLFKNKDIFYNQITKSKDYRIASFGELNKDKIFYVIRRYPGAGLFSNFSYVLNHLQIADKFNYIPFVDMENYPSWYNEKDRIKNTFNSWEYYFDQVSDYKIKEIYKSANVIFTGKTFYNDFEKTIFKKKSLKKIFDKYIKIKDTFLKDSQKFIIQNFKNKKTLGVYLRDGEFRSIPNHALPPTKKQIINNVKKIFENGKYEKIFLCSKEKNHIKIFEKYFKDRYIVYDSFRSEEDCFAVYPRKNHRYLLGAEILTETLILSQLDGLIFSLSNVSSAAIFFNLNPSQKKNIIDNGYNHHNRTIALFYWYIKNILPEKFGGFKKNAIKEIINL